MDAVRAGGGDPRSKIALRLVDALLAEQPRLVLTGETHPCPFVPLPRV